MHKAKQGFTLIELLVVIAILAILMVAVVMALNPSELLKQARDSNRLSDLSAIKTALALYQTDVQPIAMGNASTSYLSLYDAAATGANGCPSSSGLPSDAQCAASSTYRLPNSTGWIPVDLTKISIGSPLSELPVDPINTAASNLYYTYATDGTLWEVCANAESQKFQSHSPFTAGTDSALKNICPIVNPVTTYTLTYTAGSNGTLSGSSTQTVAYGGSGTSVTAVPNTGYYFTNWSDGSTANPRTDTNVQSNISVTANFAVTTYTLTYTAGSNGTLSGSSTQTVAYGGSGTQVTAVPNTGYYFTNWSDGSTANPRTDTNVQSNISVTANFAVTTYTLTYTAGSNGTLSGSSTQTVAYGGSGTQVTAVPNTGYYFTNWSDGSTANPRTDTNVQSNISVTANFAVTTYTLTYTAGSNGTLSGSSTQTVAYGGSGTQVTAVPNTGYYFTNWSDGSTANPRTDTNVQSNISVTANFAIIPFACGTSTVTGSGQDTTVYHTVVGADGNCWLASNLGTANIANSVTDSSAYGWLYQWGRLTDGHQVPTSAITTTLSTTDVPGNADFIEAPNSPYDWRSPQNNNLWQGGSTAINNPCPTGWSIPTQAQWSAWVTAVGLTSCSTGCDTALYNTSLKLTDAGFRSYSDASLYYLGANGYYYSSSVDSTYAYDLAFGAGGVYPADYNIRATAFSARCVKD